VPQVEDQMAVGEFGRKRRDGVYLRLILGLCQEDKLFGRLIQIGKE
jgi:hypothetical protein